MVIRIFCHFTSFTFFMSTNWGISEKSVLEVWKFHFNRNLCKAHTITMKSNIFNKQFQILTYSCICKYRFVYNYEALYYAQYMFFFFLRDTSIPLDYLFASDFDWNWSKFKLIPNWKNIYKDTESPKFYVSVHKFSNVLCLKYTYMYFSYVVQYTFLILKITIAEISCLTY